MLGKTHVSIGIAALAVTMPELAVPESLSKESVLLFGVSLAAVTLGSLAPDLDHPGSTLRKEIPFGKSRILALVGAIGTLYLNWQMNFHPFITLSGIILLLLAMIKHRGITHSVLGFLLAGFGVFVLQSNTIYEKFIGAPMLLPFLMGYGFHILADMFSPRGVPLLYPFNKEPKKIPFVSVRSGGIVDRFVISFVAFVFVLINWVILPMDILSLF